MEKRDDEQQSLGFCHRLFNFLMSSISGRGLKRVTLGRPTGHGLSQLEPVSSATKPVDEASAHIPFQAKRKNDTNSQLHIKFEKAKDLENSANTTEKGSAIVGDNPTQLQEAPPLRTIPVRDHASKYKPNDSMGYEAREKKDLKAAISELERAKDKPLKEVPLKDGTEERGMARKEENLPKEKLKEAIEPEKDVNRKDPIPLKPILRSVSNINEKSEAFIRRKRQSFYE